MSCGTRARLLWAAVAAALVGCAAAPSTPSPATLSSADYGARPVRYGTAIREYFAETLKDPRSAEYRQPTAPQKGYMRTHGLLRGTMTEFGWLVTISVNSKNSYGGYVGFEPYTFLFRGDQIVDVIPPDTP